MHAHITKFNKRYRIQSKHENNNTPHTHKGQKRRDTNMPPHARRKNVMCAQNDSGSVKYILHKFVTVSVQEHASSSSFSIRVPTQPTYSLGSTIFTTLPAGSSSTTWSRSSASVITWPNEVDFAFTTRTQT